MFRVHVIDVITGRIVKTIGEADTLHEARIIESKYSINLDYEKYYTEIEVPKK